MAISTLTRQLLWERSGYKCVLCQKDVARSIHAFSGSRSFGTLCQIVSENRESPRYEWYSWGVHEAEVRMAIAEEKSNKRKRERKWLNYC